MLYVMPLSSEQRGGVLISWASDEIRTRRYFRHDAATPPKDTPLVQGEALDPALAGMWLELRPEMLIRLEDLRANNTWKDFSLWAVTDNCAFNMRAECFSSRLEMSHFTPIYHINQYLHLYVPDTECTFDDMAFVTFAHADCPVIVNPDPQRNRENEVTPTFLPDSKALMSHITHTMPRLIIEGPESVVAGQRASYQVRAVLDGQPYPYPLDIYLESVNGFLPRQRVRINPAASFPLFTHGLEAGDEVKLKAGFRFFSGLVEKKVVLQ